jgi:hypothetical protein
MTDTAPAAWRTYRKSLPRWTGTLEGGFDGVGSRRLRHNPHQPFTCSLTIPAENLPRDGYAGPGWRLILEYWPGGPVGLSYNAAVIVTALTRWGDQITVHFRGVARRTVHRRTPGPSCPCPS